MERFVDAAAAGFDASIETVASLPRDHLSAAEIVELLERIETGRRRLEPLDQQLIEQLNSREGCNALPGRRTSVTGVPRRDRVRQDLGVRWLVSRWR
ncbi:MAG TPA: hypothetical protein VH395_14570 [Jatrophihabitantaceae bacterium]